MNVTIKNGDNGGQLVIGGIAGRVPCAVFAVYSASMAGLDGGLSRPTSSGGSNFLAASSKGKRIRTQSNIRPCDTKANAAGRRYHA